MTSTEAAERLRITPRRVTQLAKAGKLPGLKEGRDWHFESADVEAFAALNRPSGYPKGRKRNASPG